MVPFKRLAEEVAILEPQSKVVKFFKTVFRQNKGGSDLVNYFLEELATRANGNPDAEFMDFKKWFSGDWKRPSKPTSQLAPAQVAKGPL